MKNPDESPEGNIHAKFQQLHSLFFLSTRACLAQGHALCCEMCLWANDRLADKKNLSTEKHHQEQERQQRNPKMAFSSVLLQRAGAWFRATGVEQQIKERDTSFQPCSQSNSLSLLLCWLCVQCTTDELNASSPLTWSQNATRTIAVVVAVAVIVVTRQQVAGIERERRGEKSLCV